jgi:hypothetical protein
MTDQHPITPSLELRDQWILSPHDALVQAAQWGADQELEACCEWLGSIWPVVNVPIDDLRAARRPEPLTLKELALASVKRFEESGEFFSDQMRELEFIRKALEQLND